MTENSLVIRLCLKIFCLSESDRRNFNLQNESELILIVKIRPKFFVCQNMPEIILLEFQILKNLFYQNLTENSLVVRI